jgi:RNA polymerase sigma-70 factor (ECF subfamily)
MTTLKAQTESKLLIRLKNGDERALRELYEIYWEKLFISAYNLLKNREVCEDILQEIYISLWNKRETLTITTTLQNYLYACVTYKVYDFFRKNSGIIKTELLENFDQRIQAANPETALMHQELVVHINNAIESLPEKCKVVFKLSREEQLTHKEIAEKLNISTKTVEAHITKSLRLLRISIGSHLSVGLVFFLFHDMFF